jgi:hypothetical protein
MATNAARPVMVPDHLHIRRKELQLRPCVHLVLGPKGPRLQECIMSDIAATEPAEAVSKDAAAEKAPDPRRHYASPEDLREDIDLDLETREELLRQWKQDLDQRLEAEAEGMSASDPISQEHEARLASEERRVSKALDEIVTERQGA